MAEVIRVRGEYYILATSALADDRTRVLKHGETFAVLDRRGDARRLGAGEQGLYHAGTRFLSRSVLHLAEERPLLLGSVVTEDNVRLVVDLTNPDLDDGPDGIPLGTLHVLRSAFLWDGAAYERLRVENHGPETVAVDLRLELEADFADLFEVRGTPRHRRGTHHDPVLEDGALVFAYDGLDGVTRRTRIRAGPGAEVDPSGVRWRPRISGRGHVVLDVTISCETAPDAPGREPHDAALDRRRRAQEGVGSGACRIETSNEAFNDWLNRSWADLRMMVTETPHGPYPYAGVPWFSTPFGRDALITAYEALWVQPELAAGVLRFLAATQATETDPARKAEPGKILHEYRLGEMAATGEVPFGCYYGSADATPLFVLLGGAYHRATGDTDLVRELWPSFDAALGWIIGPGDLDGDGFIEYSTRSADGLVQQGWKDSNDSVFHADGSFARPPIALCEVQAYAYGALLEGAGLCRALGDEVRAEDLLSRAEELRTRFEDAFWLEDLGTYALALDGEKRPCRVRTSNAGHALLTGIAAPDRAARVAETLLGPELFGGWGIRTLATREVRYRPISYHNGSVWPHDNALVAMGLARYGHQEAAGRVMAALFDASLFLDLHRLPELWCGFPRRPGSGPTEYPLACAPQAWAAAAPYLLLRACLGLSVDASAGELRFVHPTLPPFLQEVRLSSVRIGKASVDLTIHRYPEDVAVRITRRDGDVEVLTTK